MDLGIVCSCEGPLSPPNRDDIVSCMRCGKDYPGKELRQVLKLLDVAYYEAKSEKQTPPTDEEKRSALRMAAVKLTNLKLKAVDLDEIRRQPVRPAPPPPPPSPPAYAGWSTTTISGTWFGFSNVIFSVRIRVE
jgi:hypothetical protein